MISNQIKIPIEISDDSELRTWFESKLTNLGEEPSPWQELNILEAIKTFYDRQLKMNDYRFTSEGFKKYIPALVSSLMENGWEEKKLPDHKKEFSHRAEGYFRRALILNPNNPKALYRLGHLSYSKGKNGVAVGYFTQALELASKQTGFQADLKLNHEQIINAQGLIIAIVQKISSAFENPLDLTFNQETIGTVINSMQNFYLSFVEYSVYDRGIIKTKTIGDGEYDNKIQEFRHNPNVLIIDRFNAISLIRHMDCQKSFDFDSTDKGKLNYLLKALQLEPEWEFPEVKNNTKIITTRRINDDLKALGVSDLLHILYSDRNDSLSAECKLEVHYFKSLLY